MKTEADRDYFSSKYSLMLILETTPFTLCYLVKVNVSPNLLLLVADI
jgi:hypothetical protein